MRELVQTAFSAMWSGWVAGLKQVTVAMYPGSDLGATWDAVFKAGDNMQRGAIDLIAGLFAGSAAGRRHGCCAVERDVRQEDVC